jgi:transposase
MTWRQGQSYSEDLRARVLAAVDGGIAVRAAAAVFRVSVSYIYKALGRRRTTGETTARRGRVGRKPKLAAHDEALRVYVVEHPDATIEEIQAWLLAEREVKVSVGCLWNRLRFLGLTLKKSHSAPPNRIGRTSPRLAKIGMRAKPN